MGESEKVSFEFYGHASVLIKFKGVSILTDPWFCEVSGHGNTGSFPQVKVPDQSDIEKIDAIQISHIHLDHFCPKSLSHFRKDIPVFIAKSRSPKFLEAVKSCGFSNIIEIPPGFEGVTFGPFRLYQFLLTGSPSFDSSLVLEANGQRFFFNNDSIHESSLFDLFSAVWGGFEGVFAGGSFFSPYVTAYDQSECQNLRSPISRDQRIKYYQNIVWDHISLICQKMKPRWVVPYAAGIRFFSEDTWHYNEAFSNPYYLTKINLHGARAKILWPRDIIDEDGRFLKQVPNSIDTTGFSEDQPERPCQMPMIQKRPTTFRLLREQEVSLHSQTIEKAFLEMLSNESSAWASPMRVKFRILTEEGHLPFAFSFDGRAINKVVPEGFFDLEVDYPSEFLLKLLSGRDNLHRIHYGYSQHFQVRIKRLVFGQMNVHLWRMIRQPSKEYLKDL